MTSYRYYFSQKTISPPILSKEKELLKDGIRSDGRNIDSFRRIFFKVGLISQASGSAYVEIGETKVICSVHGPRPLSRIAESGGTLSTGSVSSGNMSTVGGSGDIFSDKAIIECDFKYTSFANKYSRKGYLKDQEEREYSNIIAQALEISIQREKFPKSTVGINILVLQDAGSSLSTAITCASLALADAGVPMYDLIAGCTICKIQDTLVLDPTIEEEQNQIGLLLVSYSPTMDEVTQIYQVGVFSHEEMIEALNLSKDSCSKMHKLMNEYLIQSIKEDKSKAE